MALFGVTSLVSLRGNALTEKRMHDQTPALHPGLIPIPNQPQHKSFQHYMQGTREGQVALVLCLCSLQQFVQGYLIIALKSLDITQLTLVNGYLGGYV